MGLHNLELFPNYMASLFLEPVFEDLFCKNRMDLSNYQDFSTFGQVQIDQVYLS